MKSSKRQSSVVHTKKIKKAKTEVKTNHHTFVLFRPVLAVLWGIGSTHVIFSLLYSLCFYPAREVCTTPYEWLSIVSLPEKLIIFTLGLPSFITDIIFRSYMVETFQESERLWVSYAFASIIVAYIVLLVASLPVRFLRKMDSKKK